MAQFEWVYNYMIVFGRSLTEANEMYNKVFNEDPTIEEVNA